MELRQVISGSAAQSFWLRDKKLRPQVVLINQCCLPGRRAFRKVREEEEEEEVEPVMERKTE